MHKINKYIPEINRIEFAVTYACSSKCRHCSVGTVKPSGAIKGDVAAKVIKDITNHYKVNSVMTFGGEPLLYPDTVCSIHKTASECGIPERQVITNGYLSKKESRLTETAGRLIESGVNNIMLSVDTFHSEFVPLKLQYAFAKALCDRDFKHLKLHPAWVVNRESRNQYNDRSEECLDYFADLKLPVSGGNNIFPSGNAKLYLSEFYPKSEIDIEFRCGQAKYTSRLDEVKGISINPNGDVIICAFPIGNIYKNNILDLIADYDPYQNPVMSVLAQKGIRGLLALAKEQGVAVEVSDYYSPCDVCRDISQKLIKPAVSE
jgi:MoaA/NifB/PqqE/SkfB family radical SAM enzyme